MAKKRMEGQIGLFPPPVPDWKREELPDLRGRPLVAIDLETYDRGLIGKRGPGWAFGAEGGYICGVSWSAEGSKGYAPIRHPDSDNFDQDAVVRWLNDISASDTRVIFHNAPYDIGWLGTVGAHVPVHIEDTLAGMVMLDETQRDFDLDACARREGIPGKSVAALREAVEHFGGVDLKKPQKEIWRVPAAYAAEYAIADAEATRLLHQQIEAKLRTQGVWDAYRIECELIPMTVAMRRRGIRIDDRRAWETAKHFRVVRDRYLREIADFLERRNGVTIDELRSPKWMETTLLDLGVQFPYTAKSVQRGKARGSFSKDWMEHSEHPVPRAIVQALKYEEAASKFIETFILGYLHRGRIHSEVHQFLSEDGGARSHRLSYSDPPLQQMTSPDKDPKDKQDNLIEDLAVGTKLRACFLPEPGEVWLASDYSQQEPRLTVHYADVCNIDGVEAAVERYRRDPRTDYHRMVAEMTGFPRPRAKILNLAMTYGKGKHSLAEELKCSVAEAEDILKDYHERLPFIKPLEDLCKRRASDRGYVVLIDGARMRYTEWEGGWLDWEERKAALAAFKKLTPCSRAEAEERQKDPEHPWSKTRLRRAETRKALNNLIQGSAARQTKKAMLDMWRAGYTPLLQMHDDLNNSVHSERQVTELEAIMVEAIPLRVPVVVDSELGNSWGWAKIKGWSNYIKIHGDPSRRAA